MIWEKNISENEKEYTDILEPQLQTWQKRFFKNITCFSFLICVYPFLSLPFFIYKTQYINNKILKNYDVTEVMPSWYDLVWQDRIVLNWDDLCIWSRVKLTRLV